MKFASLLQKVTTLDPTVGDPWDILEMATIGGARTLDLDAVTGSLETGKRADIVTVDLRRPHTTPLMHGDDFNVPAHLVFSATGADVVDVWVDGHHVVGEGRVLNVDEAEVVATAQAAAEELFERRRAVLTSA
jgi:5-methylthioadenosine/S-adenosylhomocysteine deaminase